MELDLQIHFINPLLYDWCKQIKGDSPEMVEYIGMQNLIKALEPRVGLKSGKLVFGFEGSSFFLFRVQFYQLSYPPCQILVAKNPSAVSYYHSQRSKWFVCNFTDGSSRDLPWGALDDVVMGGVSQSSFQIDPKGSENGGPTGLFKGLSR